MPLGADDAESAGRDDVLALGGANLPRALEGVGTLLLGDLLIGHALLGEEVLGECGGVASQEDVRSSSGHVRGDGHGSLSASLGHDLRLALVILGVEHLVSDAALVQDAG